MASGTFSLLPFRSISTQILRFLEEIPLSRMTVISKVATATIAVIDESLPVART
jgi:hypothetical protein